MLLLVAVVLLLPGAIAASGTQGQAGPVAWGSNRHGQLGDGTARDRARPVAASLPDEVVSVAAGGDHTIALTRGGAVWAWGGNRDGELGSGASGDADRLAPGQVEGLSDLVAVAAGYFHSLALRSDGTVWSWGDNTYGQLGYETELCPEVVFCGARPRPVDGLGDVVAVAAGFNHSIALRRDSTVWAWGNGREGQLGDGTRSEGPALRRVQLSSLVIAVAAGGSQSLALSQDGSVWSWGAVDAQRTYLVLPARVAGLGSIRAIAAGEHHALALAADGTVWAWGDNEYAQLGDGTAVGRGTPAPVPGLREVVAIAAGTNHNVALTSDGGVWTWGWNEAGQLGDGTRATRPAPARVDGLARARAIGVGPEQVFALADSG